MTSSSKKSLLLVVLALIVGFTALAVGAALIVTVGFQVGFLGFAAILFVVGGIAGAIFYRAQKNALDPQESDDNDFSEIFNTTKAD